MNSVSGRIAEITGPCTFTFREEVFRHPEPGEVLLRITRVGVCATDLAHWKTGPERGQPPIRLGHEPVGVVQEVGSGVRDLAPGQVVTGRIEPTFADYVYAHPTDIVRVPKTVDPAIAIGEPLGCVVDAYQRTPPAVGEVVAVVGLGFMGLLMTSLLALSPASAIWAIGRGHQSRMAALAAGATHVYGPDDPELPIGTADLVVEATGVQAGLDIASNLAAEHGRLSVLGYHQDTSRVVDMRAWNWKCLTVVNAHVRDRYQLARSTSAGMQLLASDRFKIAPLFTHQYAFEYVNDAFQTLLDRPSGFIKAVIILEEQI